MQHKDLTREKLIEICTPQWTKDTNNPNGWIRVDDIVQIMSLCSGLLLEHINEDLNGVPKDERIFDGGGDDTAYDYVPQSLTNIHHITKLHMNLVPNEEDITFNNLEDATIIKNKCLAKEDIYFMDEDRFTEDQLKIYRTLSTAAGASWEEYDDLQS